MFWFGKKNKKKKQDDGAAKPSREEILAQARATAAAARAEIGDETLEKIREALMKKENSPFQQARKQVMAMDRERIADNIKYVMEEGGDEKKR